MTKEKRQYKGAQIVSSTNGAGTTGYPHVKKKKNNLVTDLIFFTKLNSQWITDINVKCKTINLLGDNIGENLDNLGYGDDFLDTMSKA